MIRRVAAEGEPAGIFALDLDEQFLVLDADARLHLPSSPCRTRAVRGPAVFPRGLLWVLRLGALDIGWGSRPYKLLPPFRRPVSTGGGIRDVFFVDQAVAPEGQPPLPMKSVVD